MSGDNTKTVAVEDLGQYIGHTITIGDITGRLERFDVGNDIPRDNQWLALICNDGSRHSFDAPKPQRVTVHH
ncbi:hypothetical protein GS491_00730 [Rhodococcus hoagii]|nr:hypothetical protein [Prescottella equi]NKS78257.1 hypothetical protein [Prescottella equi]NKT03124.1 hypothetical protein [Prescottella equi]